MPLPTMKSVESFLSLLKAGIIYNRRSLQMIITSLLIALCLLQCKKEADPPDTELVHKGTWVDTVVYSSGLEGNLLGDSPDRQVMIYLPPGYEEEPSRRYPVIYFLHGFYKGPLAYSFYFSGMDRWIEFKVTNPIIIVLPNSQNKYMGSFYTNSEVTGQWEDFIVQDMVKFMDSNFRTIASAEGRGLAGHSMGGYGTFMVAMRNPGIFNAIYALSAADLDFNEVILGEMGSYLVPALQAGADEFFDIHWEAAAHIAAAAAFAPNPDILPFYGELPVTENGGLIDSVWQKWLAHDPSVMLPEYKDNLQSLRAIQFDCGTSDFLFDSNVSFSDALDKYDVDHVFLEYDGDHENQLSNRISDHLIPFFSEMLDKE